MNEQDRKDLFNELEHYLEITDTMEATERVMIEALLSGTPWKTVFEQYKESQFIQATLSTPFANYLLEDIGIPPQQTIALTLALWTFGPTVPSELPDTIPSAVSVPFTLSEEASGVITALFPNVPPIPLLVRLSNFYITGTACDCALCQARLAAFTLYNDYYNIYSPIKPEQRGKDDWPHIRYVLLDTNQNNPTHNDDQ